MKTDISPKKASTRPGTCVIERRSFNLSLRLILVFSAVLVCVAPACLQATIPAAALADSLFGLGYLNVLDYSGVTNNGTGDCTAGLQNALTDAFNNNRLFRKSQGGYTNRAIAIRPLAVFFPPGTYCITNTLCCYEWDYSNGLGYRGFNVVLGSTAGTNRPVIKLAANAPYFTNTAQPRQMISFRCFWQRPGGAPPPIDADAFSPLGKDATPPGYKEGGDANFYAELRNIDFDCNSNVGAVGVVFNGAQWCSIENVKVWATNALAGFYELPGAGAYSANIEVDGGKYGVIQGYYPDLGLSLGAGYCAGCGGGGPTVVGLTLANQTEAALTFEDVDAPMTVAGLNITNCHGEAVATTNLGGTSQGVLTLLDGQISMGGSGSLLAVDNGIGNDLYLRNIYVGGTTNLVKSAKLMTPGAGAWSQIAEYSYNNEYKVPGLPPNPNSSYALNTRRMNSYSLINGTMQTWSNYFPVTPTLVMNSPAPPSNLVSEHLPVAFPSYNGAKNDPPTVVVSTNAGFNNTNDATTTLQAAIDVAHNNASYGGRVFLPGGIYFTTNTLTLYTNTVLLGAGRQISVIQPSSAWKPTNGMVPIVETQDSASGTTELAFLSIISRRVNYLSDSNYNRFNNLTWQVGRKSLLAGVELSDGWTQYNNSQARSVLLYTNNGGGSCYMFCTDEQTGDHNSGFRYITISRTTQPLWIYALNVEGHPGDCGDVDVEISGASNVRLVGLKRENTDPELWLTNCTNIAGYGFGDAKGSPNNTGNRGYFQVLGSSTNILLGNLIPAYDAHKPDNSSAILYEAINGQPTNIILWPNAVSLYKRGTINDSYMFFCDEAFKKL